MEYSPTKRLELKTDAGLAYETLPAMPKHAHSCRIQYRADSNQVIIHADPAAK